MNRFWIDIESIDSESILDRLWIGIESTRIGIESIEGLDPGLGLGPLGHWAAGPLGSLRPESIEGLAGSSGV